jgi:hypothetical protein
VTLIRVNREKNHFNKVYINSDEKPPEKKPEPEKKSGMEENIIRAINSN